MGAEQQLHMSVAQYLTVALDQPWTTFPAGGGGKARGGKLKAMGFSAGWPDIQIIGPGGRYIGIELKTDRGRLSPTQNDIAAQIKAAGGAYHVCRSIDDVENVLWLEQVGRRKRV